MRKRLIILSVLIILNGWLPPVSTAGTGVDHAIFTQLLQKYVTGETVDYDGFKKEEALLDQYLEMLSNTDVDSLSKNGRFAFYINAYNAFTIKLILTEYPGINSIKDIGGLFSSPWKLKFVPLGGKKITLDDIEHGILRPTYKDARVHFAVNCASKGCPPLRNEAFEESRLDSQLDDQTRKFINTPGKMLIKGKTVYISKIFKWFKEDFNEQPVEFIKKFADSGLQTELKNMDGNIKVKYLDYDWSLNKL